MSSENETTQEQIDAAIIQCLRIFAARGRQLRLQRERERLANLQTGQAIMHSRNDRTGLDSPPITSSEQAIEDKNTLSASDPPTTNDASSDEPECPSSISTPSRSN